MDAETTNTKDCHCRNSWLRGTPQRSGVVAAAGRPSNTAAAATVSCKDAATSSPTRIAAAATAGCLAPRRFLVEQNRSPRTTRHEAQNPVTEVLFHLETPVL